MTHVPRLIAFEGPDGAGKSTLLTQVSEELTRQGIEYEHVRNPGGTPSGEAIRELLLSPTLDLVPMAQVHLFIASRIQLIEERIKPAIMAGRHVLCDRLDLSTLFYQTAGYKWSMTRKFGNTSEVNDLVLKFYTHLKQLSAGSVDMIPHRYLILDASDKVLKARRPHNPADRFEMKEETFQKDVRAFYRQFVETHQWDKNVRVQMTNQPISTQEIQEIVEWMTQAEAISPTQLTA